MADRIVFVASSLYKAGDFEGLYFADATPRRFTFPGDPGDLQAWFTGGGWINWDTLKCDKSAYHLHCLEI